MKIALLGHIVLGFGLVSGVALADSNEVVSPIEEEHCSHDEGQECEDDDHEHEHDHDHEGEFDLHAFETVFAGVDLGGEVCYLGVLPEDDHGHEGEHDDNDHGHEGEEEGEHEELLVQTSFSHEGESAGILSLELSEDGTQMLGTSETGSIVVNLKEGETTLAGAFSFAVSWSHEGHTDRGFCQDLTLFEVPEEKDEETAE